MSDQLRGGKVFESRRTTPPPAGRLDRRTAHPDLLEEIAPLSSDQAQGIPLADQRLRGSTLGRPLRGLLEHPPSRLFGRFVYPPRIHEIRRPVTIPHHRHRS